MGHGGGRAAQATMNKTEREWSHTASPVHIEPFTNSVGPTFPLSGDPTEVILIPFTPELLEVLIQETNQFAALCLSAAYREEEPPSTWITTSNEMKALIGFTALMSLTKLPDLYDYWSSSELLHSFPVASCIPGSATLSCADIFILWTIPPSLPVERKGMTG